MLVTQTKQIDLANSPEQRHTNILHGLCFYIFIHFINISFYVWLQTHSWGLHCWSTCSGRCFFSIQFIFTFLVRPAPSPLGLDTGFTGWQGGIMKTPNWFENTILQYMKVKVASLSNFDGRMHQTHSWMTTRFIDGVPLQKLVMFVWLIWLIIINTLSSTSRSTFNM